LLEITGNCSSCGEMDILNVKGGICYECWSNLDYLEHEKEVRESETSEEE
jgi:hypothetical protein